MSFDPAGMLTDHADVEALAGLARLVRSDNPVIVEVGTWAGRTALAMADAAPTARIFCVDHWNGSATDRTALLAREHDVFDAFARNCGSLLFTRVFPLKGESRFWAWHFHDASADLIFIDAGHDFEECAEDITMWRDKVRPGGVLCGHDFEAWHDGGRDLFPGVSTAVRQYFGADVERHGKSIWAVRL